MKNYSSLTPWRRFLNLLQLERRDIYRILSYAIFSSLVGLSLPLGIQSIINLIQGGQVSASWLVLVFFVIAGIAFSGFLYFIQLRIGEDIQQRIFTRSSLEFIYRFPKIKLEAFRGEYPPELANRFFDTLTVQKGLVKTILDYSAALLQILFGLILLSFYHPFFIAFGFLLLGLMFIVFKFSAPVGVETSLKESKHKYEVAHWIEEVARSLQSFKMSGLTSLALEKNDALVVKYLDAREKHFSVLRLQFFKLIGFKVLVTAGLLLIGGLLVLNQQMNIGQFVAAEIIILLVITSVEKLMLGLEDIYDILASIEKIGEIVDMPLERQEGEKPFSAETKFELKLENLSLQYPNNLRPIFENINLSIRPKEHICITGPSGSGKTSLLYILAGLISPTDGKLLINGIDMQYILPNHYRAQLGFSLTGSSPFEGTLKENITFNNPNISHEELLWAIEKARLTDFVKTLPKGINTTIYPEGKQLSYTISKKIILARAIVHKPKLLLLKDPLDQLDYNETKALLDFLFEDTNPWTIVVASKNELWQAKCKRILKLENGQVLNS
ncbi:MAG: ATP-binding cassette domain-containing protein [Bacteroidetes bacterium]|nr:ATP-binding cassette domain-containing protein [Bacteroidota bacterium]